MIFEDLLSRAAEPTLQSFVGRPVTRLLSRLGGDLTQPAKLREIVLGLRTPAELLLTNETRRELLALLPPQDAVSLAGDLHLPVDDPYASLDALRLSRSSS